MGWVDAAGMPPGITAGCSTADGGASRAAWAENNMAAHVDDDPHAVAVNRSQLEERLGARDIQWLEQVHGADVVEALPGTSGAPRADAVWTREPGLALAIMTADCVPVLVADRAGTVVGAAHAGWQGLKLGVIDALLAALPVAPAALQAWIGPAICQQCYEVGADVWTAFADEHDAALREHPSVSEKRLLDLAAVAQAQLEARGCSVVTRCGWCTFEDERFYSYRRRQQEGADHTGRIASVIMLQT